MLTLNVTPIFKARGIDKPYTFLVKAGISPPSASNILSSNLRTFRLDHIELLCRVLICSPNDLLLWTPDKTQQYSPDHPLFDLTRKEDFETFKDAIASMPYKQLKEITKKLNP